MGNPFEKPITNNPVERVESEPNNEFLGIRIEGDEKFLARTRKALEILGQLSEFSQIKPFIGMIRQSERSGMRAYDEIPTYEVADATSSSHSAILYASTIAHDGFHSLLYHQERERLKGKNPDADSWTGTEAEIRCLEFQLKIMEQLTDDQYLLEYVRQHLENPTYQGDNRSEADYKKRDW